MSPTKQVGWRYAALIGILVGGIGLASYPIMIHPMLYPEEYQRIQKKLGLILGTVAAFHVVTSALQITRKNIRQEDIQPGNMKVWTDPFDRKKD